MPNLDKHSEPSENNLNEFSAEKKELEGTTRRELLKAAGSLAMVGLANKVSGVMRIKDFEKLSGKEMNEVVEGYVKEKKAKEEAERDRKLRLIQKVPYTLTSDGKVRMVNRHERLATA